MSLLSLIVTDINSTWPQLLFSVTQPHFEAQREQMSVLYYNKTGFCRVVWMLCVSLMVTFRASMTRSRASSSPSRTLKSISNSGLVKLSMFSLDCKDRRWNEAISFRFHSLKQMLTGMFGSLLCFALKNTWTVLYLFCHIIVKLQEGEALRKLLITAFCAFPQFLSYFISSWNKAIFSNLPKSPRQTSDLSDLAQWFTSLMWICSYYLGRE